MPLMMGNQRRSQDYRLKALYGMSPHRSPTRDRAHSYRSRWWSFTYDASKLRDVGSWLGHTCGLLLSTILPSAHPSRWNSLSTMLHKLLSKRTDGANDTVLSVSPITKLYIMSTGRLSFLRLRAARLVDDTSHSHWVPLPQNHPLVRLVRGQQHGYDQGLCGIFYLQFTNVTIVSQLSLRMSNV